MTHNYGTNRVLEPQHVLPTSAWRLDNGRKLSPAEIRVDIKRIHIEGTALNKFVWKPMTTTSESSRK